MAWGSRQRADVGFSSPAVPSRVGQPFSALRRGLSGNLSSGPTGWPSLSLSTALGTSKVRNHSSNQRSSFFMMSAPEVLPAAYRLRRWTGRVSAL